MTASRHTHLAIGDLLDILPDAVIMVDAEGLIVYANPSVQAVLGHAPAAIVGQPLALLVPHKARERHEGLVARFRESGQPTMMGARPVLHAVHRSGRLVPVSISLCNLALPGDEPVSVAVIHDVSALHTHLDLATAQAETDALTGLGNRLRLSRRMSALLAGARAFGLLRLDLQGVEQLIGAPGHAIGDAALRIVGHRLKGQVRAADLAIRLGGEAFVLLLDGLDDGVRLQQRAQAVAASLTRPLRLAASPAAALGVNIGGALSPRHGDTESVLLEAADSALLLARQSGLAYRLASE